MTKTHVDLDDVAPAGLPDECFWCNRKIGDEHCWECVKPKKTVRLRVTFEYDAEVPRSWDKDAIEFHHNESSWCLDNIKQELEEFFKKKPNTCHLCSSGNVEFLHDIVDSGIAAS